MSTFSFTSDEPEINKILSCKQCIYLSTKKHLPENESCPLCNSDTEIIGEQKERTGMPPYKYNSLLSYLEEEVSGVGLSTVDSIREHFEDGDDFLDATRDVYDNQEVERLSCVSGVGSSTSENIAKGIARKEGWSGGLIESTFALSG